MSAQSVRSFAGRGGEYYAAQFKRIQDAAGRPAFSFNAAAALLGPLWAGGRALWGWFGVLLFLEIFALTQICRGLWGELGAEQAQRSRRLAGKSEEMLEKARVALEAGAANAESLAKNAENLQRAADKAAAAAQSAAAGSTALIIGGVVCFAAIKAAEGLGANAAYERKYARWRTDKSVGGGFHFYRVAWAGFAFFTMLALTAYRFAAASPAQWLVSFPAERGAFGRLSSWLDERMDALARGGAGLFDGVGAAIRALLDAMEVVLAGTPWPAVFLAITAAAWRLAGARVAVFTAAGLAYLGVFGFWEKSMVTVALLGTAAALCVVIGVPLGVWCGKSRRAYQAARPVLDFMQTMPAFVYLIPVIAFFGTGKPPGVIATIIFGLPPVARLTALGIRQVPADIKEAALAFGCTRRKLLWDIELPLAMPSIMAGINQTILMCLSMVVIASLIGAKGLGEDILIALQYAAKGQGLLAGLAILFCAMIIDRIVQGRFKRAE